MTNVHVITKCYICINVGLKEENGCLLIKKGVEILHLRRTAAFCMRVGTCLDGPLDEFSSSLLFAHIFTPNNPYFLLRFGMFGHAKVCVLPYNRSLFHHSIVFAVESVIISWLGKLRMYNQSFPLFHFIFFFVSQCFNDGPKMMVGNCTISILHLISSLKM